MTDRRRDTRGVKTRQSASRRRRTRCQTPINGALSRRARTQELHRARPGCIGTGAQTEPGVPRSSREARPLAERPAGLRRWPTSEVGPRAYRKLTPVLQPRCRSIRFRSIPTTRGSAAPRWVVDLLASRRGLRSKDGRVGLGAFSEAADPNARTRRIPSRACRVQSLHSLDAHGGRRHVGHRTQSCCRPEPRGTSWTRRARASSSRDRPTDPGRRKGGR